MIQPSGDQIRYSKLLLALCLSLTGCATTQTRNCRNNACFNTAAYQVLKHEFRFDKGIEEARIVVLDLNMDIIGTFLLNTGDASCVWIDFEEMFTKAKALGGWYIIMAHNHPQDRGHNAKDVLYPSKEDIQVLHRADKLGEKYGVMLLDSIIVAYSDYTSVSEYERWRN